MKNKYYYPSEELLAAFSTIQDFFDAYIPSKKYQHLLIQNKWILLDGKPVNRRTPLKGRLSLRLYADSAVIKPLSHTEPLIQDDFVLYEDAFLLAVYKQSELLVHDDGNAAITLCDLVARYFYDTGQACAIHPLHRLDYDTSGIVLFCKSEILQPLFDQMMTAKAIKREYLAVVEGYWKCRSFIVEKAIAKDRHSKKRRVSKQGQYAKTTFTTLYCDPNKQYSVMRCQLASGRTHQIRVHCADQRHALLGDPLYGKASKRIARTALHADRLSFYHPFLQKQIVIHAALPDELAQFLPKEMRRPR